MVNVVRARGPAERRLLGRRRAQRRQAEERWARCCCHTSLCVQFRARVGGAMGEEQLTALIEGREKRRWRSHSLSNNSVEICIDATLRLLKPGPTLSALSAGGGTTAERAPSLFPQHPPLFRPRHHASAFKIDEAALRSARNSCSRATGGRGKEASLGRQTPPSESIRDSLQEASDTR